MQDEPKATKERRAYIQGRTYDIRGKLAACGWTWSSEQTAWFKDGPWADKYQAEDEVRALGLTQLWQSWMEHIPRPRRRRSPTTPNKE